MNVFQRAVRGEGSPCPEMSGFVRMLEHVDLDKSLKIINLRFIPISLRRVSRAPVVIVNDSF